MWRTALAGLALSLLIAGILSWFASPYPDGLERVASDLGFDKLENAILKSPFAGYGMRWVKHQQLATSIAGLLGVALSFAMASLVGKGLNPSRSGRHGKGHE